MPWKTDNWFVSPWNYIDEVVKDYQPPQKVKIHDVTLRDGEQQAGIIFIEDDKIRIAEKLSEVGIHRIEEVCPRYRPVTRPPSGRSSSAISPRRSSAFAAAWWTM